MTANYKGRTYTIETMLYGTRNQAGSVCFGGSKGEGGVHLSSWMQVTSFGNRTVDEALEEAHTKAEALGFSE